MSLSKELVCGVIADKHSAVSGGDFQSQSYTQP